MPTYEYIWLDAVGAFRSKVRILEELEFGSVPEWNYDGSSTGQATTAASEVLLLPVRVYKNKGDRLVLCMAADPLTRAPLPTSARRPLQSADIWFGFEQEFFIYDPHSGTKGPLGDLAAGNAGGRYYCQVGGGSSKLRALTEEIFQHCLAWGLGVVGWNLEVAPGQTEIQVFGAGLRACDDLMMLRYMATLVLDRHGLAPAWGPKPFGPTVNGSGLHTNVSTGTTRGPGGYGVICRMMETLAATHADHIAVYGADNHLRLTGSHETASMTTFSWGVGSRDTSIRIPRDTERLGYGYFEDRRPAANADPYLIATRMDQTIAQSQM